MDELFLVLQKENQCLKDKNEQIFRKTKNKQRTILRLKKIIEKQNIFLKMAKKNNLEDQDWEDLDELVKEYKGSD